MGGAIAVDSAPGVGSTFTLTLPATIVAAAPARQASRIPGSSAVAGGGPRVLVAEDNHVNQVVVVRLLERQGCQVDVAANGRDAVGLYATRVYDLVLVDCYMPEMDGFEATTRMRALDTGTRTPIVALTASVLDSDRRRCVEAGMDEVLAKPIEADVLAEAVRRWTAKEVVTTASAPRRCRSQRAKVGTQRGLALEPSASHPVRRRWTYTRALTHRVGIVSSG